MKWRAKGAIRSLPFRPRLWPWLSLAMGLLSAVLMDRRPHRAYLVVAAIVLGWVGILATVLLSRIDGQRLSRRGAWIVAFLRTGSRSVSLGPVQFSLFFTLPFYWRAAAGTVPHYLFIGLLASAAALTLWDPLQQAIARRALCGGLLHSVATFAGLDALLPLLGLSNAASLTLAATATALSTPLVAISSQAAAPAARVQMGRRFLLRVVPVMLLWPALMATPFGRRMVPAAPLRLVGGDMGTRMNGLELADPSTSLASAPGGLVCFSRLWAPTGVRDALVHVWRKDGVIRDRIPLDIRGGREAGFRTFSLKQNLGRDPAGIWTCSAETVSGQFLGARALTVGSAGTAGVPPAVR